MSFKEMLNVKLYNKGQKCIPTERLRFIILKCGYVKLAYCSYAIITLGWTLLTCQRVRTPDSCAP